MTEIDDVPTFDITVKKESLVDDMFEIYSQLFKDEVVSRDEISFEELCGMPELKLKFHLSLRWNTRNFCIIFV